MRVGDGDARQKTVQQRLDGRAGRRRIDHAAPDIGDHLFVGHVVLGIRGHDVVQANSREVFGLGYLHVGAGALYVHEAHRLTEIVRTVDLDRGIAAAPEHQGVVLAHNARHVDQLVERGRTSLTIIPAALHGLSSD